ncbi:hypothetical protein MTO96_042869 [Rhipicephalus appendiculatus]
MQDQAQTTLMRCVQAAHPTQPHRFGKILLALAWLSTVPSATIEELFFRKTIGTIPIARLLGDIYDRRDGSRLRASRLQLKLLREKLAAKLPAALITQPMPSCARHTPYGNNKGPWTSRTTSLRDERRTQLLTRPSSFEGMVIEDNTLACSLAYIAHEPNQGIDFSGPAELLKVCLSGSLTYSRCEKQLPLRPMFFVPRDVPCRMTGKKLNDKVSNTLSWSKAASRGS